MSTIQCCCCTLLVRPLGPAGYGYGLTPVVGATVDVFWNHATRGAFRDPDSNDSHQGPYTTTRDGVTFAVADPSNEVVMVRVAAAGMTTTYAFTWVCGAACAPDDRLGGLGRVFGGFTTPILTGASLTTNLQTVPLVQGGAPVGGEGGIDGTASAAISGGITGYTAGALPVVTGGAYTLKGNPNPNGTGCAASTGTPGFIGVGCRGIAGINLNAFVMLTVCPGCQDDPPGPFGSCTTPTDFCSQYGGFNAPAVQGGVCTSVEYSPFRVRGTWNPTYNTGGIYPAFLFSGYAGGLPRWGVAPTGMTAPAAGSPLVPLRGDWVIQ